MNCCNLCILLQVLVRNLASPEFIFNESFSITQQHMQIYINNHRNNTINDHNNNTTNKLITTIVATILQFKNENNNRYDLIVKLTIVKFNNKTCEKNS